MHDPKIEHANLPSSLARKKKDKTYKTVSDFLKVVGKFESIAQKLNATYVYDEVTGLKLFGKMAYYVETKSSFKTFLRKLEADKYAKKVGSKTVGFKEAINLASS